MEEESSNPVKKDEVNLWQVWKHYGEHFIAPLILLALIILAVNLISDNHLKKDILNSPTCGYYDNHSKIQCYCAKRDVDLAIAKMNPIPSSFPLIDDDSLFNQTSLFNKSIPLF